MKRTFNAVGQGGFYTEKFNNFNMVFDCGSETDIEIINQNIKKRFHKRENIDAVFISHLHNDHVNGLVYLLNFCKVKRVFLPLLTEEQKLISLIDSYCKGLTEDDFCVKLIESPEDIIGEPQIIYVKPDNEDNLKKEDNYIDNESIHINQLGKKIDSGAKIKFSDEHNWVFVPYNFEEKKRAKQLIEALAREHIELKTIDELKDIWKDDKKREKITDIYKSIRGDLNTNSMVVYSGMDYSSSKRMNMYRVCRKYKNLYSLCYRIRGEHEKVGCLYLGDYDSKGKNKCEKIKDRYIKYWGKIGIIQIPHHGSHHNYNDELLKDLKIECIISSGLRNRFNHPHIDVVRKLYKNKNINLHIINEFKPMEENYIIL